MSSIHNHHMKPKILSSILSCDFSNLQQAIEYAQLSGAEGIHVDVMDGSFVNNISFGPCVLKSIRKYISVPIDVHLMVGDIDNKVWLIDMFNEIGVDRIYFHYEASNNHEAMIKTIKDRSIQPGMAINPETCYSKTYDFIDKLDSILVMTVNPGFGYQKFIDDSILKINNIRDMANNINNNLNIISDGGVNGQNAKKIISAGSNELVIGSAMFSLNSIDSSKKLINDILC